MRSQSANELCQLIHIVASCFLIARHVSASWKKVPLVLRLHRPVDMSPDEKVTLFKGHCLVEISVTMAWITTIHLRFT